MRLALAALAALLAGGTAGAQAPATVVSAAPARVAVTVYRNPDRSRTGAMDLRWLGGFALVTETRTVRLPRGRATVRFEGVAAGIVPVSAIVDGLPGGTVEKNRDKRLLSPASLVDGSLGRSVTLLRTDRATGRTRVEPATIVAGPQPGVVLRTPAGIETLRCSGLGETLRYPAVPPGLSPRPVLSVTTVTPAARTATVTLSYLSEGFDWSASYVGTLAPDGRTLALFAWLTLANGNAQAFRDARIQAVAGRLNRQRIAEVVEPAGALRLTCYPLGTTTSDLPTLQREAAEDIVVTASRVFAPSAMAAPPPPPPPPPPLPPQDLGDLKLYTVPQPATVNPNAQKQVALLAAPAVAYERRYRRRIGAGQPLDAAPTAIALVVRNTRAGGLGIALPTGTTTLYATAGGERLLVGTGTIADRAAGETLRLAAGESRQVLVTQQRTGEQQASVTVSNANRFAITAELPIGTAGQRVEGEGLARVDGVQTWTVTLPPNGSATLRYRWN